MGWWWVVLCPRESGCPSLSYDCPGHQHTHPLYTKSPKTRHSFCVQKQDQLLLRKASAQADLARWLLSLQQVVAGSGIRGGEVNAGRAGAPLRGRGRQVEPYCHLGPVPGRATTTTTTCGQPAVRGSLQTRLSADSLPS